jgi:hypothetical protein
MTRKARQRLPQGGERVTGQADMGISAGGGCRARPGLWLHLAGCFGAALFAGWAQGAASSAKLSPSGEPLAAGSARVAGAQSAQRLRVDARVALAKPAEGAGEEGEDEEGDEEDEADEGEANGSAATQGAAEPATPAKATSGNPSDEEAAAEGGVAVNASLSYYAMHAEPSFWVPVVSMDANAWHVEARYNYEAPDTGSLFLGRNVGWDGDVEVSLTPMLGLVSGNKSVDAFGEESGSSSGVAPGLEASVSWRSFDVYLESEYFIDRHDHHRNYLSSWSELGWRPLPPLRLALTTQRTRTVDEGRDVQRGALVQWTLQRGATLGLNFFNPGSWRRYTIASLSLGF